MITTQTDHKKFYINRSFHRELYHFKYYFSQNNAPITYLKSFIEILNVLLPHCLHRYRFEYVDSVICWYTEPTEKKKRMRQKSTNESGLFQLWVFKVVSQASDLWLSRRNHQTRHEELEYRTWAEWMDSYIRVIRELHTVSQL